MNYVEAPGVYRGQERAVFLAGGITDAENWQAMLVQSQQEFPGVILNPRRAEFQVGDEELGRQQIEWEYRHLKLADLVAFWFPPQTLCPIALFELGACCESTVPLVVGTNPDYARRFDVVEQLRLRRRRPDVTVVSTLDQLGTVFAGVSNWRRSWIVRSLSRM